MDETGRKNAAEQTVMEGIGFLQSGAHEQALGWYRQALSLYTEAGSEEKRTLTAENVAWLEAALKEPSE